MDLDKAYIVNAREFEADVIQLSNGKGTNVHRQKLKSAGVFAFMVAGRCLFTASRKNAVGSSALLYIRKKASCQIWYNDYLGALPSLPDAEIRFYLCDPEEARQTKKSIDFELKPILNANMVFSDEDEVFLEELFPGVRERQQYLWDWKAKGISEIQRLEYQCRDTEEILKGIADLPLEELAEERQKRMSEVMQKAGSSLFKGRIPSPQ